MSTGTPRKVRLDKARIAPKAEQRAIKEAQFIRLSVEEQRRFVDLLLNPPPPAAALRRARKGHAKLIVE